MITPSSQVLHHTLSVAAIFWAGYLVLVSVEAALGSNVLISGLFFFSIPVLVALLTWVNLGIVYTRRPRRLWSVFALGGAVLGSASVIILVGLVAAAKLKALLGA